MSTKIPTRVHPYPAIPGSPGGVGTFHPAHPYASSGFLLCVVNYWTMGETSGTRYDSVGTLHLTDVNTVGYDVGKNGNAASFVRANTEYLRVTPNAPLNLNGTGCTVNMWVYPTALEYYPLLFSGQTEPGLAAGFPGFNVYYEDAGYINVRHGLSVAQSRSGFGLQTMRERVAQIGGQLIIESNPGEGTTLAIQIPLEVSG